MMGFVFIFIKTVFVLSVITLCLFKFLTKEKEFYKNKKFLRLLFWVIVFLIIRYFLLPFSVNIMFGKYEGTIFSRHDPFGIYTYTVITSLFAIEPFILFYSLAKNILFIIKKRKNRF